MVSPVVSPVVSPAVLASRPNVSGPARRLAMGACFFALSGFGLPPALAQRQLWMLGPGSEVTPSTEVAPTNCVTAPDGTITCDTELRNRPGSQPARPSLEPFGN